MTGEQWWSADDLTNAQCAIEDARHNYRIATAMGHIDERTTAERHATAVLESLGPVIERMRNDARAEASP